MKHTLGKQWIVWGLIAVGIMLIPAKSFAQQTPPNMAWNATYSSGAGDTDNMGGIAVDASGNVYESGTNTTNFPYQGILVKYDSSGNVVWNITYSNSSFYGVAVDSSGNVYVSGSSYITQNGGNGCLTMKYDSSGNVVWNASYYGYSGCLPSIGLAIDASGDVYDGGFIWSSGSGGMGGTGTSISSYFAKYDSSGDLVWAQNSFGISDINGTPAPLSFAVDPSGNVYVAGFTTCMNSFCPGSFIGKYDSSGNVLWGVYNPNYTADTGVSVAVDPSGGVYVMTVGNTTKYSSSGNVDWNVPYSCSGCFIKNGGIAVDSSGNVYVSGVPAPSNQINTVKYDGSGNLDWNVAYNNNNPSPVGVAVDPSGNIYVGGNSNTSLSAFLTVKYVPANSPPPPTNATGTINATPQNYVTGGQVSGATWEITGPNGSIGNNQTQYLNVPASSTYSYSAVEVDPQGYYLHDGVEGICSAYNQSVNTATDCGESSQPLVKSGDTDNFTFLFDPIATLSVPAASGGGVQLTAPAGGSSPSSNVTIENIGSPGSNLTWSSSIAIESGPAGWLSISQSGDSSGLGANASDTPVISADMSQFTSPGTYVGTITITPGAQPDNQSAGAAQVINVTLTVTNGNGNGNGNPVSVSINPSSSTVEVNGGTQLFTAIVHNDSGQGVTWSLSPISGAGTLSGETTSTVTYNAPATLPGSPFANLTATSIASSTVSAIAPIKITEANNPPPLPFCNLSASPSEIVVPESSNLQYSCYNVTSCDPITDSSDTSTYPVVVNPSMVPAASGTDLVYPTANTTYNIFCQENVPGNPTYDASSSIMVTVQGGGIGECPPGNPTCNQ
jgi:Beta-propeller repeat